MTTIHEESSMIDLDGRPAGADDAVLGEATPEETAQDGDASPAGRGRRVFFRSPGLLPTLTLVALLLAVGCGYLGVARVVADQRGAEEGQVVAIARQTALNLTSTDPSRAGETLAHLQQGATGAFAAQLATEADSFVRIIQSAGVTSTSSIGESGIERMDDGNAEVVVVVNAQVTNVKAPEGEERQWRMRLTVQKQADDRWLVSGLDFVA